MGQHRTMRPNKRWAQIRDTPVCSVAGTEDETTGQRSCRISSLALVRVWALSLPTIERVPLVLCKDRRRKRVKKTRPG